MAHELSGVPVLQLPFNAAYPVQIAQGFHGPFHRLIRPMRLDYAIDFGLSFGSIVRAARRGTVVALSMNSDKYSLDPDLDVESIQQLSRYAANWILLDHDGAFQTLYGHLQKESQRVCEGQVIERGQILARTGKSGWIGDIPNLHFHAQRWMYPSASPLVRGYTDTLPVRFEGYAGPMEHTEIMSLV